MSLAKKLGMGSALISSKLTGRAFPVMINWAITGKCNLRCSHCYGSYGRIQNEELPFDLIKRTVDEACSLGTRRITIEGGEPLVRNDIAGIVDYMYQRGLEMSLCTNGVLLDRYIDRLKNKIDLIVFSLDGIEEHHDRLRGKGNYRKVLEAIDLAKKNGFRVLLFSCLVDENIEDVDYLVKLAEEKGVNSAFNIAVSKLKSEGEREGNPKPEDARYRKAIARILELKSKGAPIYYSKKNFQQALSWSSFTVERLFKDDIGKLEKEIKKALVPCFAGRHFCYIESSGGVYPCYQTVGLLPAGNIKDPGGLKEAFAKLSRMEYCKACYNVTLSELNLQCRLDPLSVLKVASNYLRK